MVTQKSKTITTDRVIKSEIARLQQFQSESPLFSSNIYLFGANEKRLSLWIDP